MLRHKNPISIKCTNPLFAIVIINFLFSDFYKDDEEGLPCNSKMQIKFRLIKFEKRYLETFSTTFVTVKALNGTIFWCRPQIRTEAVGDQIEIREVNNRLIH